MSEMLAAPNGPAPPPSSLAAGRPPFAADQPPSAAGAGVVLLFDGHCGLCSALVRFVLRHDRRGVVRFLPLQQARGLLPGEPPSGLEGRWRSVILLDRGVPHTRSGAVLLLLNHLGRPWKSLAAIHHLPASLRDRVYDWVAAHRYRWFGRHRECLRPPRRFADRFLKRAPAPPCAGPR